MRSKITHGLQAIGAIALFLTIDLLLAPWCFDRSRITNKFLILDYLGYVEATPTTVAAQVRDLRRLPEWLSVPDYEILEVSGIKDDSATIHLQNIDGNRIQGRLQSSRLEQPNSESLIYLVTHEQGAMLFEYRLTLQPVAGQTRITHLSVTPKRRAEIVGMGPGATGAAHRRLIDTHKRVEAQLRDEF